MFDIHQFPSQRETAQSLQTNYLSPRQELMSTISRQMSKSTYQRPKVIKKSTTISVFRQHVTLQSYNYESGSPIIQKCETGSLKKIFQKVYIALIFINSLQHYQRQLSFVKSNTYSQNRKFCIPFYPDDFLIEQWKKIITIATFCSVILYPLYLCYYEIREDMDIIILILGVIFLCDITLNCFICYIDENYNLITNIRLIIQHYMKTWMIIDIIATVPLDLDSQAECFIYFKMMRVIKYFLSNKTITYKGQVSSPQIVDDLKPHEEFTLQTGTKYLINVLINAFLLIHIFGCFEHYTGQYDYIASIYWAAQTITTVGAGDLKATYELSIIWMIVGVTFYTFTIGDFSLLMIKSKANLESEILFSIEQLSHSLNLPEKLKYSFLTFIKSNLGHNPLWKDENQSMIKELPYQLKNYITISSYIKLCLKIPFFLCDINYSQSLLQNIKCLQVEEGQLLWREGQNSNEIFFLLTGSVKIMTKDQGVLLNILEGTMFGEFEAIEEKLRGTYCIAQTLSRCIVIPYRIVRTIMERSETINFEIRQLYLRRRNLIIRNFIEEKQKKLEYKRQNVRFFTDQFLQMTRQEYELEKQKKQLQSLKVYNNILLQKLLGKKRSKISQFLIKFKRSVQRIIEMNNLLDETLPEQWKELQNYKLIKRVFPKKYLQDKYEELSISRRSSSVHSAISRLKYSCHSQKQYFLMSLPEIKIKHIILQHIRATNNKFIAFQQIISNYQNDPEAIIFKRKEQVGRSKWNKYTMRIQQTIMYRVDQIEESGEKYFKLRNSLKTIESLWLKGSMQKFELFQLMHEKEVQPTDINYTNIQNIFNLQKGSLIPK